MYAMTTNSVGNPPNGSTNVYTQDCQETRHDICLWQYHRETHKAARMMIERVEGGKAWIH